jgi:CheY-like chemotaxis protein
VRDGHVQGNSRRRIDCWVAGLPGRARSPTAPKRQTQLPASQQPSYAATRQPAKIGALFPNTPMNEPRALVLLAEDDADSREMYAVALALDGFQTVEAADGAQALARIAERVPDVIVTDLHLPRVDGLELCERLKSDVRTQHVPIVALTGAALEEQVQRAHRAGCARVLIKPFPPDLLGSELAQVLAIAGITRPSARS